MFDLTTEEVTLHVHTEHFREGGTINAKDEWQLILHTDRGELFDQVLKSSKRLIFI